MKSLKKVFAQKTYCGKEFYEQYIEYLKLKTELVEKQEQVWLQASEDGNDYKLEDSLNNFNIITILKNRF